MRIGAGLRGIGESGKSRGKVGTLSLLSSVPGLERPAAADRAPSLVRPVGGEPREGIPAPRPARRGGGRPAAEPFEVQRYRGGRHWCVIHAGELVVVTLYRRGAAEVARRLNAAAGAARPGRRAIVAEHHPRRSPDHA